MTDEKLAVLATKIPASLKDSFESLAKLRTMTPSALLRRLVEDELAGAPDYLQGQVERATAAHLAAYGIDESNARGMAALNMARRVDRDPVAGAANTAQLRGLLSELVPVNRDQDFNVLQRLRLRAALKLRGWAHADALDLAEHLVDEAVGLARPGGAT
ncbi:hypothetical protein [Kribbella sp.]|uniref:hypothetical protein n=1 Tax=Kribbella sp. TaxID=1871183 RepID=UPI002D229096|nr:hypothetical protein [Kribbella sp.]HZX05675.1 hypothetical protein [Kribbella sp.]